MIRFVEREEQLLWMPCFHFFAGWKRLLDRQVSAMHSQAQRVSHEPTISKHLDPVRIPTMTQAGLLLYPLQGGCRGGAGPEGSTLLSGQSWMTQQQAWISSAQAVVVACAHNEFNHFELLTRNEGLSRLWEDKLVDCG